MRKINHQSIMRKVPHKVGCYIFMNGSGEIIYVGKAKDLRKRVASYFSGARKEGKTPALVSEIQNVDFIITRGEVEALLVEATLIKQHQPKYNIDLKSGQRYAYVRITDEEYPRLETARKIKKSDRVFGPYTSGQARLQTVRLANRLFQLRQCKRTSGRPCLLYHIGLCCCPYATGMKAQDYRERIKKAEMFLRGQTQELLERLASDMREHSKRQEYEKAKMCRDQMNTIQMIQVKGMTRFTKNYDQDVIHYILTAKRCVFQLFHIQRGVISGRKQFSVSRNITQSSDILLAEFIKQYYFTNEIPNEIILPHTLVDQKNIQRYLGKKAGRKVSLTIPQRGDKLKLLRLLEQNLHAKLQIRGGGLLEIQEKLRLPFLPKHIECFDISNLGHRFGVGSMVHFTDGIPDKNQYRRFKIKTVSGQSDFHSMREIVFRRYLRLAREKAPLPQFILVDGGKPQLGAALSALSKLKLNIPVAALAKRFEEIYLPHRNFPLRLPEKSEGLRLLRYIRDEAHRFAIKYHRLRRSQFLQ